MSKIKTIQIDDFRIYNGRQEFRFDNAGVLSNLMVIYAPNGFGKTSFFDAVEWCYASTIRRFESEVLNQEITRRDYSSGDKILLTNRQSYKSGRHGSVTITTSDDKIVKRNATDRKANKMDFKYDYRTLSSFSSDIDADLLKKLVKTNILSQDQIDEFLRYTKPDERFFQLQSFWPEGESAVLTLQKVDSYLNLLTLEKRTIDNEILTAEKQLREYLNAEDQIAPLNSLINGLNRNSVIGFKLDPLSNSVNSQTYDAILDTTQGFIERAKLIVRGIESDIIRINDLIRGLQSYLNARDKEIKLEDELKIRSTISKLYKDLRTFTNALENKQTQVNGLTTASQKISRFIELVEPFKAIKFNIDVQRETIKDNGASINAHLLNINVYNDSMRALQSSASNWESEDRALRQSLLDWDTEVNTYQYWKAERNTGLTKLEEAQEKLLNHDRRVEDAISQRHSIREIHSSAAYDLLSETKVIGIKDQIHQRNVSLKELGDNAKASASIQSRIQNVLSLDETFDRILAWGEQFVRMTDATHCPLCATNYHDTIELLERIDNQKSSNNVSAELRREFDLVKNQETEILQKLDQVNQIIDRHIQGILIRIDSEITALQNQRELLASEVASAKHLLDNSSRNALSYLSKLHPDSAAGIDSEKHDFNLIKRAKELELDIRSKKMGRLLKVISGKKNLISSAENNASILRNKISTAENSIKLSEFDNRYIESRALLEELDISEDALSKELLNSRLLDVERQIITLRREVDEDRAKIEFIRMQIMQSDVKDSENELPGILFAKQEEQKGYKKLISDYKVILEAFSDIEHSTSDHLQEALIKRAQRLENTKYELSQLEDLFVSLKVVEKNVSKNRLEELIGGLTIRAKEASDALGKVKSARKTAEQYISGEINTYFNQEVINQIYSRIEPHPDLNRIEIQPKVTEKGLILDIRAISRDEELDPSLYLSAGQLNVLSLSIFLAKAFETRNNEIDTIFMDDPIQNLSDINILSFIDLIRTMITKYDRQIVISSHDENFYKLMRNKMPTDAFNVRYYEIESFGNAKCKD